MTRAWRWLPVLSVFAAACGDGEGVPPDAAVDAGTDADTVVVTPPERPALAPCPDGWRAVDGEPSTCEPWPVGGRASCAGGEAHFPGDEACAPVGDPCPGAGDYPEDLPDTGEVRFVRAGAPPGGDGSADAPFATIADALAVRGRATIALAAGDYVENVYLPSGVALIGACAARTRIEAASPSLVRDGAVTVFGSGVVIRNVTISGSREGLVVRGDDGSAEVRGVVVDGAFASGVSVFPGNALTGSELVVRDVTPADGTWGYGIAVAPDATVSLSRVVVERAVSSALPVLGEATLSDVALLDPQQQPADGRLGTAVEAIGGARVVLSRAIIEGAHDRALMVSEPGTHVTLSDAIVRGTEPRASDDGAGNAAFVFDGALLDLERTVVADHREAALLVSDASSRVVLRDVVVRGTRGRVSDGGGGSALALQAGAEAEVTRSLMDDNRGIAVFLAGGSAATLTDVTVRATGSESIDGRFGTGLHAQEGSSIVGTRVLVAENRSSGITAIGSGSRMHLTDATITGTLERECAVTTCPGVGFGDGAIAAVDGSIELERFVVEGSARAGVHVGGGTMDLRRGTIVRNAIGAAIQTPGFDVGRLSDDVLFLDNGRNVDMTALPLPEPSVEY